MRWDGRPVDPVVLGAMNDSIHHRGPNSGGQVIDGGVGLANRRLAILDLGEQAELPMTRGSITLAYNGEVYNFRAERAALEAKGYTFSTTGDTEVVLALYREHGDAFVDHLDGMFAFALWDAERQRLLLGRDAAGKKPLYLHRGPALCVFGSEIKALLHHPEVPRKARESVLPFVTCYGYAPTPEVCFQDIEAVRPGVLLAIEQGSVREVRTFGRGLVCTAGDDAPEAWIERLLETLREGIRERLVSDVPVGAFLSGGVDSSLVVALMSELGGRVRTYSIGFRGWPGFDEAAYARQVAEQYGTEHTEFHVEPPAIEALLPRIVWHHDQPYGDESSLPTLLLSELTADHVTVALCGDAGDELFGGYHRFRQVDELLRSRQSSPAFRHAYGLAAAVAAPFRERGPGAVRRLARRVWRKGSRVSAFLPHHYLTILQSADPDWIERLYGQLGEPAVGRHYAAMFDAGDTRDWLSRILDFNYRTYLLDDLLIKMDRMSMAASLEVRSPFLSQAMIDLASAMPTGLKVRGGVTKWILKEASRRYLPDAIIDRPKMGFGVPLVHWWREPGPSSWLKELLLGEPAAGRGIWRREAVEAMIAEHLSGRTSHAKALWTLATIEQWYRLFIDPVSLAAPSFNRG